MYKTDPVLIEKCRVLRRNGFTLNEIIEATRLPKTTIYNNIQGILLSIEAKERIKLKKRIVIQKLIEFSRKRKGKCLPGRIVPKPDGWTEELIFLVAHFMFDGEITKGGCIYHNRNKSLINHVKYLMKKVFHLNPWNWENRVTGVYRICYYYVELADYAREKAQELKKYIIRAPLIQKKIFLQAFFDDEGSVNFDKKLIRGFQHNLEILKLVQNLLKNFYIESKIDDKYQEIIVSRKSNIIKFRGEINFSKGIFINPARKNSIWKKKLEKRKILGYIINSYKN